MDFEMPKSHVYIKTDEQNRIVRCEGEYSLPSNLSGWILIDEGAPCDKRNLAQSMYFDGGLYTVDGIPRYKWDGTQAVERTEEELEADRAAQPEPVIPPTNEELAAENKRLKQQVSALTDQQSFYEDCIAEMATVVYA